MLKRIITEHLFIKLVLLSGIVLSLYLIILNRSIWRDEAVLALNIINRSSFELLKPLDNLQIAPVLFLQAEKLFSTIFHDFDLAMRLFPLICFFLALHFFYRLLSIQFVNLRTVIFGLSLFVFNAMILRYSSEVKQYMGDVLAISAIYYFMVKNYVIEKNKAFALAITGIIIIFLSNIAPIILFSAGLYLLHSHISGIRNNLKLLILPVLLWGITFAFYYLLFIYSNPNTINQVKSFSNVDGFLPINLLSVDFYQYMGKVIDIYFKTLLPFGKIGLITLGVLYVIGILSLFNKKQTGLLILTLSPVITHLVLSAMKMYPTMPRLMLYHTPLLIINISFGFEWLVNTVIKISKSQIINQLVFLLPIIFVFYLLSSGKFPYQSPEIKKSITYVQQHIKPNEKLFVTAPAKKAFQYYAETHFASISNPVIYGKNWDINDEQILNEFKKLSGRTWLLFVVKNIGEQKRILEKVENAGFAKIDEFSDVKTFVYLFDFGNN